MSKLDRLYGSAFASNINIVNGHFSKTKKAVCLASKTAKNIVMDMSAIHTQAEELTILAEEVGHFETGALYVISSTYNTAVARSNRVKYEAQAKRWAIKEVLPLSEIKFAIANAGNDWEAAEHCGVTVEFYREAVEYYGVEL